MHKNENKCEMIYKKGYVFPLCSCAVLAFLFSEEHNLKVIRQIMENMEITDN
jgi:hypothetical protein